MIKFKKTKLAISLAVLGVLAGFSLTAMAGGFQLLEENVTNLGNAYAGTSAQADDASTEYFNPAGMTRLNGMQVVASGTLINLNVDAHINSATSTLNVTQPIPVPPPINPFPLVQSVGGDSNDHPGANAVIPSFHVVYPFDHKWALGFGANVPFGLETQYSDDSMARMMATDSSIQVIDIGPSIAYQFNPHFSLGGGVSSQYMSATFNQVVPPVAATDEGRFTNDADNWAWGYHLGALYQFTPCTRLGLTYHSQVTHDLKGNSLIEFQNLPPIVGINVPDFSEAGHIQANITLPQYLDLSFYHDINAYWAILAGLDWTNWAKIQTVTANFSGDLGNDIPSAELPFNFRNTWRPSLGVNFRPNDKWTLRAGTAYDESPVDNSTDRTFRLPDSNRVWAALGAQYIINKDFTVDVGYSHLFVQNSSINNTQTYNGAVHPTIPLVGTFTLPFSIVENATGNFNSSVNEFGVQLTWNVNTNLA